MVMRNAGPLYQHYKCRGRLKECRCRLKKVLGSRPSEATQWDNVYSPWTNTNSPPRPRGLHPRVRWHAPAKVTSHVFEGCNPMYTPIPSEILPVEEDGDFIA